MIEQFSIYTPFLEKKSAYYLVNASTDLNAIGITMFIPSTGVFYLGLL